jgi:hypothetical protein
MLEIFETEWMILFCRSDEALKELITSSTAPAPARDQDTAHTGSCLLQEALAAGDVDAVGAGEDGAGGGGHVGPSMKEKKQAAQLMQSTETLMKFGFMSMSMTYFSSLNLIRAMRTVSLQKGPYLQRFQAMSCLRRPVACAGDRHVVRMITDGDDCRRP